MARIGRTSCEIAGSDNTEFCKPWVGTERGQDPEFARIIEQDLADGRTLGVRKTPQFFVNGRPLVRFGNEQLKSMLDAEVAKQYPEP